MSEFIVMKLSVIIPAWNEEALLPGCLESVRANLAASPLLPVEVIVVDNNSTDATPHIAAQQGAKVVFEGVNQIARARNAGAAAASGDWLLFLDADSRLSPGLAGHLQQVMQAGRSAGCGATMQMVGLPAWARVMMRTWNGVSRLCHWAAGSFLACRAQAFREVGGFSEALYAAEEIDLSRRLKRWARPRRLCFPILTRFPLQTSARKLELYSGREILGQLGRLIFRPVYSLRHREALGLWYEGRRGVEGGPGAGHS